MISTIIKSIAKLIIGLFLIFIAIGYFLGETAIGLQTTIRILSHFVPGDLSVEHAGGRLFSSFYLVNASYRDSTHNITLHSLDMDWDPSHLFHGELKLNQLNANGVKIESNSSSTQNFSLRDLRFLEHISAKQIAIYHLTILSNQKPSAYFKEIFLKSSKDKNTFFHAETLDGELHGKISIDWNKQPSWSIDASGNNINPGQLWTDWPGKIDFTLTSQGSEGNMNFQVQKFHGNLRHYPIDGHINISLQNNQFYIQKAQLAFSNTTINATGSLTEQWNIHWNIHIPNLKTVLPKSSGAFDSSGELTGARLAPLIRAKIITHDIHIHNYTIKKIDLGLTGSVTPKTKNMDAEFNIAIANQRYLHLLLSLPKTTTSQNYLTQPLSAKLTVNIPTLNTLKDFIPAIQHLNGSMQGTLELKNNLTHPHINGSVNLLNGNIKIPKLGISLVNINLRAIGNETGRLTYTGQMQSNPGIAQIQGTTDFNQTDFPTDIAIQGNNLQAVNLSEYKLYLSPDIKIHLTKQLMAIQGKISIPSAEIIPKDFGSTITLPNEVIFVGETKTTATSLLDIMPTMQLNINLGDKVYVHYQDLETTLRGNLHITKELNRPATATGELYSTSGTYRAYGKILKIQDGRLIYTGGMLTNPGLNIKATRQIKTVVLENTNTFSTQQSYTGSSQQITLGVQVLGTLNNPHILLFSIPADLSQTDILSYLILGIPQSKASVTARKALSSAISSINFGGNGPSQLEAITTTLQKSLGLTELNVESVQTFSPTANQNQGGIVDQTSVVVGKEIAPNLSMHYSVGVFNPVSILNLRYRFGKHWSVQSETSTIDTGVDLLYSIERE